MQVIPVPRGSFNDIGAYALRLDSVALMPKKPKVYTSPIPRSAVAF